MDIYLFRRYEFETHYNCSILTNEEWRAQGQPSFTIGLINIISGVFFIAIYIPCLIVMLRPELIRYSCFKIMLYLGIIDIVCLSANALLTGVLSLIGSMPCPYLEYFYPIGCIGIGLWCTQCAACILLAFNRCVDIWKPRILKKSFYGKRTYFWIAACIAYMLYVIMFTRSAFFNSKTYAWYFNPYRDITGVHISDETYYTNKTHFVNNIVVIVVLPVLYFFLSLSIRWKSRGHTNRNLTRMQIQVTIQSFFVCLLNFTAAVLYIYMQFFPTPMPVVVFAQVTWQFSNGGGALIYLSMNRTIRRNAMKLVFPKSFARATSTVSILHSRSDSFRTYV
ncbi:hypothetical protein QR680_015957 [Steinernema hermaphroditum]|uniref:Uncharacterized protein n=1 Tax=Steinernema hermaphroditum TaxID=289476 RepID=A0AA39LLH7_9BILA|nr:hypothetical protein QR680_015957 [Steinernema hermaphroditum]